MNQPCLKFNVYWKVLFSLLNIYPPHKASVYIEEKLKRMSRGML